MDATARPARPNSSIMVKTVITVAAVTPPIFTLLPPKADTKNPPIIAEYKPVSGDMPEEMANATESGNAIIATRIPATISLVSCFVVYPFIAVKSFGPFVFITLCLSSFLQTYYKSIVQT